SLNRPCRFYTSIKWFLHQNLFQNVVDITMILWQLKREGYRFSFEDLVMLSPYMTKHLKRFDDYVIDLKNIPQPIEENIPV
ncbi:hypothetical protein CON94_29110, partial [Bacillus pseudomycoides]